MSEIQSFIQVVAYDRISFLLKPTDIPLYAYTILCLSIHMPRDI